MLHEMKSNKTFPTQSMSFIQLCNMFCKIFGLKTKCHSCSLTIRGREHYISSPKNNTGNCRQCSQNTESLYSSSKYRIRVQCSDKKCTLLHLRHLTTIAQEMQTTAIVIVRASLAIFLNLFISCLWKIVLCFW
jgi:hypothetical protein